VSRIGLGRHSHLDDDAGDPLDGLVNLFDVGMILAVAFLIAGLGLTLNAKGDKLEVRAGPAAGAGAAHAAGTDAGTAAGGAQAGATTGGGTEHTIPNPAGGPRASGRGTPVGQVYRLPDGRLVYVKGRRPGAGR
jgi:hypothetical protein